MAESSLIMKLLIESGYYDDKTMLNRCIEIKRILIASINTAKGNKSSDTRRCIFTLSGKEMLT